MMRKPLIPKFRKGVFDMKKILSLLLSAALILGLALTGSASPVTSTAPASPQASGAPTPGPSDAAADPAAGEAGENRTLVVYFSATGNTEQAANYIAQLTGGDLFELEPAQPYTDEDLNYGNDESRVSREYADESLREVELVADTVENWADYDTVFIGYPIWWGIAAWPVDGFVEANDFTGKTVIPFCTSASSGAGQSGELLSETAGTGDWLEAHRFSSGVSQEDVQAWLDELALA